jgi:cytochrome c-type biogenesis protein CcmH
MKFGKSVRRPALASLVIASAFACGALVSAPAHALDPSEKLKDPQLEERARGLSAELRCLVCQNQSIDDSDAPLAKDLRRLVRERLVTGETDAQVKDHIVARYGDFVLLKPPFNLHTLLLWLTPLLVLGAVVAGIWRSMALRRDAAVPAAGRALSPEEERRLQALLATDTGGKDQGAA